MVEQHEERRKAPRYVAAETSVEFSKSGGLLSLFKRSGSHAAEVENTELRCTRDVAARVALPERAAQAVAGGRLRKLGEPGLEPLAALGVPAYGQRRERHAVISEIAADHLPTLRTTGRQVMLPDEPGRGQLLESSASGR